MMRPLLAMLVAALLVLGSMPSAEAVDLRRPFTEAIALGYGFDNDGGADGCTDYSCGGTCYDGHTGSDFSLTVGTNVLAGADGTVIATNDGCADTGYVGNTCGGRCGNYVRLRHADGDETIYCHMKSGSLRVSNGDSVSCGQVIGQSASSGSSSGPHLHLGWNPDGGASTDVYAGECTNSPGAWVDQNAKTSPPGDQCACEPQTEVCDGKDNDCDGEVDEGDVCEKRFLNRASHAYAGTLTSDVDGDGLQDLCARFYGGFQCYPSTGDGFGEPISTSLMSEENGWGSPEYYATIRMGDLDGDGRADVCGRHPDGLRCWRSTGDGFEEYNDFSNKFWSDEASWDQPSKYTTIRLADIDGDGRDDVCTRAAKGFVCRKSTGDGFGEEFDGPEWSNDNGHHRARYYGTIRMGDVDGDGMDDACMRGPNGFSCHRSTGDGFEHLATDERLSDDKGWTGMQHWSTIRLADVDGDGKDDLCARSSRRLFCGLSDGEQFGEAIEVGALSDDSGWDDNSNFGTLRTGDIDRDGADELCIRANARVYCYDMKGGEFSRVDGPEWSDDGGFSDASSFHPIFMTDVSPTSPGELCARAPGGMRCASFDDGSFSSLAGVDSFDDDGGWTSPKYYGTIRMGERSCRDETCNGLDDDCDGRVDNGSPDQIGERAPDFAAAIVDDDTPESASEGEAFSVEMTFENVGAESWPAGEVALVAEAADGVDLGAIRPSGAWVDEATVAEVDDDVAPGEQFTFSFEVVMPDDASIFDDVTFAVARGGEPMACPMPNERISVALEDDSGGGGGEGDAGGGSSSGDEDAGDGEGDDGSTSSASTESCASASGDPTGFGVGLGLLILMGLGWRRLRRRARSIASVALLVIAVGVIGCDRSEDGADESAEDDEARAAAQPPSEAAGEPATGGGAKAPDDGFDQAREVLAVHGDWRVRADAEELPEGTDGPPRYRPVLVDGDERVAWPFRAEVVSQALLVGDGPTIVILDAGGALSMAEPGGDATRIDEDVTSQIAAAPDGCCLAYVRRDDGEQTLHVYDVETGKDASRKLGRASAWAPAVSAGGKKVAWTASPFGHPTTFVADPSEGDPRPIINGEDDRDADDLDPFPSGEHSPVWTPDGLAFEAESKLWLVDEEGETVGAADASRGMHWDASRGELVDDHAEPIEFSDE